LWLSVFFRALRQFHMENQSGADLVQCYNKGCGKKFDVDTNNVDDCQFHPGPPFFHDAYKIWNCCKKKSTDFGTWLAFPGCTRGRHNAEKPLDIVKVASVKEIRPEKEEDVIVWNGLNKPAERREESAREEREIVIEATEGAKAAIQKYLDEHKSEQSDELKIGAPCRNNSCDAKYSGPSVSHSTCTHHPGAAIFHEGLKYWSCCKKKTSDFQAFLDQRGCEKGEHSWSKSEKVDKLREDFYSANGTITVNLYCKGAMPCDVSVQSDGQLLRVKLVHGFGTKESHFVYDLWGEIVPEECVARVGERKVELILKQTDNIKWPRLQFDSAQDSKHEA
ncbi:hypothetical protein PFISCL1PPCAC_19347, partial [Pristionchus fissidentatus]